VVLFGGGIRSGDDRLAGVSLLLEGSQVEPTTPPEQLPGAPQQTQSPDGPVQCQHETEEEAQAVIRDKRLFKTLGVNHEN
jgi:hypothetical protein